MSSFKDFALPQALQLAIEKLNYTTATPIQFEAIPPALEGKDILGTAQTGTGKTAAFAIPLIAKLLEHPHATAIVLLPTRELAAQVEKAVNDLAGGSKLFSALLIGGDSMGKQLNQLQKKPRIIIGTPGRVNDHLKRGTLKLSHAEILVLDETDRMLDMGFGIQIETIIEKMPKQRQTLMFSATMPKEIIKLAGRYLNNPVRISMGETNQTAANVELKVVETDDGKKYEHLLRELGERSGSVIIFVKTKYGADRLAKRLRGDDHESDALHGDLRQHKREKVTRAFRDQKYRILVATDVAARGLDIPHIEHVINYDLPQAPEDFIHRIGRTGRAGAKGQAVSFVAPSESRKWFAIERLLNPNAKSGKSSSGNYEKRGSSGGYKGERTFSDRKPYGDRKPFGDKKRFDRNKRHGAGGRNNDAPRDYAKKQDFIKKDYINKPDAETASQPRSFAKKPFNKERRFDRTKRGHDERKSFGEKKPFGKKPFNKDRSFGNDNHREDGSSQGIKRDDSRRSDTRSDTRSENRFGKSAFDKPAFGKTDGNKKSFGKGGNGKASFGKPSFGKSSFGKPGFGKRKEGDSTPGKTRSFGKKRG